MTNKPNLFVIGAMKAGTTTLNDYLSLHPDVYMCNPKEPGYFSQPEVYKKGEAWYLDLFSDVKSEKVIGDGSTCYSRWPTFEGVPDRIHRMSPTAKFIYIVRDPVKRAYSHYGHRMQERRFAGETIITYKEAIETDREMLEAGLYASQLNKYLEYFPLESFLIINFDQLISEPKVVVRKVFKFLEVSSEDHDISQELVSNNSGTAYAKETVDVRLRSIKSLPIISSIIKLIPSEFRKWVFKKMRSIAKFIGVDSKLAEKHKQGISRPDEEDNAWLYKYYKKDSEIFFQMTGVRVLD